MFDIGKTYWITIVGEKIPKLILKAVVLDENDHLLKIRTGNGNESFVAQSKILDVNIAKPEDQIVFEEGN